MMEWQEGDIVRHKTGGPKMTVVNRVEHGFYCQYFDYLGRERTSYFRTTNLVEVPLDSENNLR
jgi:uncharacterized protein YodC (DUF2158 family)